VPRKHEEPDDFDFDDLPDDDYGDLSEDEIEELEDFLSDFPELDYLDELDGLEDDSDFYESGK
jgi:hypothetical protein